VKTKEFNEEVVYTTEDVTKVNHDDIAFLKNKAALNSRKRIRLCTHPGVTDTLHEMLIVHMKGAYVRPHKHITKSESFHIIEGELKVVVFNETGGVTEVIPMANYGSEKPFYYRLAKGIYHTVIPETEFVVFHETTNGPFVREDAEFALWAPDEDNEQGQKVYLSELYAGISA